MAPQVRHDGKVRVRALRLAFEAAAPKRDVLLVLEVDARCLQCFIDVELLGFRQCFRFSAMSGAHVVEQTLGGAELVAEKWAPLDCTG